MRRFAVVALAAAVSAFVLIAAGGLVRATDSGLGCPDWPLCFGKWMPPADLHAWIEHAHRLIAGVLVVPLIGVLLVMTLSSRQRRKDRPLLVAVVVAAVLVVAQALLGAAVVLARLSADLVAAHLAMALSVLAALVFVAERARNGPMPQGNMPAPAHLALITTLVVFTQMLVGSWVTGSHAGLAYADFPLMDGRLVPHMTRQDQAVQFAHRAMSVLVLVMVVWVTIAVWRAAADAVARRLAVALVTLTAVQLVLGWLNVMWRLSALSVVPHLAVGTAMFAVAQLMVLRLRRAVPVPERTVVASAQGV
ncbi:MAG: COX15/CtaA family protein [Acidimicrobiia bacterium]|nr:COX15/CtaA family protein [Acidimicrobiia bacterium]